MVIEYLLYIVSFLVKKYIWFVWNHI